MKKLLYEGKPWTAFKNFAVIFSLLMNFILLTIFLIAALLVIPFTNFTTSFITELKLAFNQLERAELVQTINVNSEIPIRFTLPLSDTVKFIPIEPITFPLTATMNFSDGYSMDGELQAILPAGTNLPLSLNLDLPVDETVPISINVYIAIPIDETDLGQTFREIEAIYDPLERFLIKLPSSNEELFGNVLPTKEPD